MTELSPIPVPQFPLNELGQAAYDMITKSLFNASRLSIKTIESSEKFALFAHQVGERLKRGEVVTVNDFIKGLDDLKAEIGE